MNIASTIQVIGVVFSVYLAYIFSFFFKNNIYFICFVTKQSVFLQYQITANTMEQIKRFIQDLTIKKASLKQILRDLGKELTEQQINEILDQINEIDQIIEKLKKGL